MLAIALMEPMLPDDRGGGAPAPVMSIEFILWAHPEYCERL
jgi:hypothetical protein